MNGPAGAGCRASRRHLQPRKCRPAELRELPATDQAIDPAVRAGTP